MGRANSIPQNRSLNRQVVLSLWGTGTEYVNRQGRGGGSKDNWVSKATQ